MTHEVDHLYVASSVTRCQGQLFGLMALCIAKNFVLWGSHGYCCHYYIQSVFPRVEAGKNTSTVIPASRKRRRNGNPLVLDETAMYGYEFSATLTAQRLHYKLQTRPLVREGAPRRRTKQFSGKRKEKVKYGYGPLRGARHQDILTD
jgi:hypothetical protein